MSEKGSSDVAPSGGHMEEIPATQARRMSAAELADAAIRRQSVAVNIVENPLKVSSPKQNQALIKTKKAVHSRLSSVARLSRASRGCSHSVRQGKWHGRGC